MGIISAYRRAAPPLALAALLGTAAAGGAALLRRRGSSLLLVTGALLVATATRVVMLAAIEVTTFPAISVGYLSPAYPLFLAFIALALPAAIEILCVHSAPSASDGKRHPMTDAVRGESVNPK